MKIALINENSQNSKNPMIEAALKKVVEPMGHTVFNYGMYADADSKPLTYVQNGILAAVLLNSGAADYVVTGCGTGEGAMLACNSFPGVLCGHVADPLDAYTFAQDGYGAYFSANLSVTKEIGDSVSLSFFANNFTNSRMSVTSLANGVSAVFTPAFYYGLTCRIKF